MGSIRIEPFVKCPECGKEYRVSYIAKHLGTHGGKWVVLGSMPLDLANSMSDDEVLAYFGKQKVNNKMKGKS